MGKPVLAVVWVAGFLGCAAVAQASPHGPPPPPPPCSFALSVTNTDAVTATVESTGCAALAVPYSAVACLQPSDGAMTCSQAHGSDPARIAMPNRPGVAYTATGRGCAGWVTLPPAPDCQLLGPSLS